MNFCLPCFPQKGGGGWGGGRGGGVRGVGDIFGGGGWVGWGVGLLFGI